jgi:hypothetical protein
MMRKISLFTVAAALIATGFGLWAAAPSMRGLTPRQSTGFNRFNSDRPKRPPYGRVCRLHFRIQLSHQVRQVRAAIYMLTDIATISKPPLGALFSSMPLSPSPRWGFFLAAHYGKENL